MLPHLSFQDQAHRVLSRRYSSKDAELLKFLLILIGTEMLSTFENQAISICLNYTWPLSAYTRLTLKV